MITKLLYTIPETCVSLGIQRTKVYQLISDGILSPVKIGRRTLIPFDDIKQLAKPQSKCGSGDTSGD